MRPELLVHEVEIFAGAPSHEPKKKPPPALHSTGCAGVERPFGA